MESIIITFVVCKIIEIIGAISGGLAAALFLKKLIEKFYDNHGCNSGWKIRIDTFCNKPFELGRNLSTRHL